MLFFTEPFNLPSRGKELFTAKGKHFRNLLQRIDRGKRGDRSRKNNKRVKTNGHDRRT